MGTRRSHIPASTTDGPGLAGCNIWKEPDRLEVLLHVVWESVDRAVNDVRIPVANNQRVSVRRGTGEPTDANASIRARHILDDNRLTERRSKTFANHAPEQIREPATRQRHDNRNWPGRIGLRPSNTRRGRERGSARCEMEKISAGKFHFDPSLFGLSIRSPRQRRRAACPAR